MRSYERFEIFFSSEQNFEKNQLARFVYIHNKIQPLQEEGL